MPDEAIQWLPLLAGYAAILGGLGMGHRRGWSVTACLVLLVIAAPAWLVAFVYLVNVLDRPPL